MTLIKPDYLELLYNMVVTSICGYLNLKQLKLNENKNSLYHIHEADFKCSIATCS